MRRKVVLLCTLPRSGSTWVGKMLNKNGVIDFMEYLSHSGTARNLYDMKIIPEPTNLTGDWNPLKLVKNLYAILDYAYPQPALFKCFFGTILELQRKGYKLEDIFPGCDIYYILLERDALDSALSQYMVDEVKTWHAFNEEEKKTIEVKQKNIRFNFEKINDLFIHFTQAYKSLHEYFRDNGIKYLHVKYEEINGVERILRYINHSHKDPFGSELPIKTGDEKRDDLKKKYLKEIKKKKMTNHFTILIPSYNNIKWIEKSIDSALNQDYENYDIIYIDAESNDGSYELVEKKYKGKIQIVRNNPRKYQIENFLIGTKMAKPGSIIVTLDGDDWLKHNNVLNVLNNIYTKDVWMTYGSYENDNGTRGIIGFYTKDIIDNNSFRKSGWYASHLRTFRKELFLSIKDEDLRDKNGEYYKMTGDLVMEFPMLEMSGDKSRHIDEVLYVYNRQNPNSDDKVNRDLQYETEIELRSREPYERLKKLNGT